MVSSPDPDAEPSPDPGDSSARRPTATPRLGTARRAVARGLAVIGLDGRADRYLVGLAVLWLLWTLTATAASAHPFIDAAPHLAAPVVLLVGIVAGRHLSRRVPGWTVATVLTIGALVVVVGIPFYANAQAAIGVQLVALAGLLRLGTDPGDARTSTHLSVSTTMLLVVAVLLAARAQAGMVLVLATAAVVALVVATRRGPPVRTVAAVGAGLGLAAAVVVAWLGSRETWPGFLAAEGSLSSARHRLWGDALDLWAQRPLTGSGPGSFVEHSALAAGNAKLSEVHSDVLQVGAELGAVGVVLLLAMFVVAYGVATRGSRAAAAIAATAWTALAIHSSIDHLAEFPPLVLMAGVVLGWAGTHRASRGAATETFERPTTTTPRR
ncbi:O-antigen ligase family protein [Georgenia sp. Z1344]|uniref:O-antigen ligase family protein n=1 Tax=Georgenia sp. Z1344 TaxID=3416706 RepID=UPI003CF38094